MIKYNLICKEGHEFESWFSDSSEFDKLKKKKLLECIYCSTSQIKKSIMSPRISSKNVKNKKSEELLTNKSIHQKKELLKIRKYIEKNFEFVGDKFSQKVREVYYDKKSRKKIYGTTTQKERDELAEEGIDLLSVPWVSKDN